MLLLRGGPLQSQYAEVAEVSIAEDQRAISRWLDHYPGARRPRRDRELRRRRPRRARSRGARHRHDLAVHEMPQLLREHHLEAPARLGAASAHNLVFSSAHGAAAFFRAVDFSAWRITSCPKASTSLSVFDAETRRVLRQALGVGAKEFLVLGAGFAHLRKGFDLFLQLARDVAALRGDVHFCWVGAIEPRCAPIWRRR